MAVYAYRGRSGAAAVNGKELLTAERSSRLPHAGGSD